MQAFTCDQVRRVDEVAMRDYHMPGIVLMENAGRGAAEEIHELVADASVVIFCGKGNNGGDGYVIARHLDNLGHHVSILAVAPVQSLSGDAGVNARIAIAAGINHRVIDEQTDLSDLLNRSDIIVDGLLGTGAKPPLRGVYADLVRVANAAPAIRVALDIPTGLDGDSGTVDGEAFRADHTMTFVAPKVGFDHPAARQYVGEVHVICIGVPNKLLRELDAT